MKLVLKTEALTELTTDELVQVAGGVPWTPSCPLIQHVHDVLSELGTC
jgi:hypothetical protein